MLGLQVLKYLPCNFLSSSQAVSWSLQAASWNAFLTLMSPISNQKYPGSIPQGLEVSFSRFHSTWSLVMLYIVTLQMCFKRIWTEIRSCFSRKMRGCQDTKWGLGAQLLPITGEKLCYVLNSAQAFLPDPGRHRGTYWVSNHKHKHSCFQITSLIKGCDWNSFLAFVM